jgi:[ribosomal protein S18]-alanine N-acetyltransferase
MHDRDIQISFMDIADIDEATAVENVSFPAPWSRNMFLQELQTKISRSIVARITGDSFTEIAGYMIYWLVADEVHLQKIATKPAFRRAGVASRLMKEMIRDALENECTLCLLEVGRANMQAIRMYEKFGFDIRGIRTRYYPETGEDAIIMSADLKASRKMM